MANRFADAAGGGAQKLLHADSIRHCCRMRIAPRRITATGFAAGHIDYIFNSEAQSIQRTTSGRRQIKCRYESIAFIDSNRGPLHCRLTCVQAGLYALALQGLTTSEPSTEKGAGSKPTLLTSLLSAKHAKLPAVTVGIMEPQAHVFRTRCLRTDFVARIFNIDFDGFQMRERLSQSRHVR